MKLSQVKLPSYGGPSNTLTYRMNAGYRLEFFPATCTIAIEKDDDLTIVTAVGAEMKPADAAAALLELTEAERVSPATPAASARRTRGTAQG